MNRMRRTKVIDDNGDLQCWDDGVRSGLVVLMHRKSAVLIPVVVSCHHMRTLKFLPVQMFLTRPQVQSYPTRTKVMEFSQLAIRHGVWVDADYCAAPFIQLNEGVLDRSIFCMIDGKCFFYPSTTAPQFRRGHFPCMGMAVTTGVFALGNSIALRYVNSRRDRKYGKPERGILVDVSELGRCEFAFQIRYLSQQ
jgi:hypothetical protein